MYIFRNKIPTRRRPMQVSIVLATLSLTLLHNIPRLAQDGNNSLIRLYIHQVSESRPCSQPPIGTFITQFSSNSQSTFSVYASAIMPKDYDYTPQDIMVPTRATSIPLTPPSNP
ncbi:hypothetical protein H0G86_010249 [Trichoderma simmonsii]|uniref:Uncharacterized protein n=1 Tax=Trichoderma simmonsii TaxID=1491479 RepID=A0A8G0LP47_9HYPO|nr:hypothetical protein H0G86_010249 [Trichoderma simmonsii]